MTLSQEIAALCDGLGDRSRHTLMVLLRLAAEKFGVRATKGDSSRAWLDVEELIAEADAAAPCRPHHPINVMFSTVAVLASESNPPAQVIWMSGGIRSAVELASAVARQDPIRAIHVGDALSARALSTRRICLHFGVELEIYPDWSVASESARSARGSKFGDFSSRFLARAALRLRVPMEHLHPCADPAFSCGTCLACLECKAIAEQLGGSAFADGNFFEEIVPQTGLDIPLVLLVGCPFSGSTVLSVAMGSQPGFVDLGEVGLLPELSFLGGLCSCGKEFEECQFWSSFLPHLPPPLVSRDSMDLHALSKWVDLYRDIFRHHPGNRLIDASKDPRRAAKIRTVITSAKIIHLTRSPAASAASDKKYRGSHWPDALSWSSWRRTNQFILDEFSKDVSQYMHVKYEEFVENPSRELARVFEFLGMESRVPCIGLRQGHHVGGNQVDCGEGIRPGPASDLVRVPEVDFEARCLMTTLGYSSE